MEFSRDDCMVRLTPRRRYAPKVFSTLFRAQVITLQVFAPQETTSAPHLLCRGLGIKGCWLRTFVWWQVGLLRTHLLDSLFCTSCFVCAERCQLICYWLFAAPFSVSWVVSTKSSTKLCSDALAQLLWLEHLFQHLRKALELFSTVACAWFVALY